MEIINLSDEIWKIIPGYENYEISNYGRVKSLNYGSTDQEGLLKQRLDRYGYCKVSLKDKNKSVHQLVAMAFLGHKPDGTLNKVINHIDSDRTNNHINNLEIVTPRENVIHSLKNRNKNSKHIGVRKSNNKWSSSIKVNGKNYNLGSYINEQEAAEIYLKALSSINNNTFDEFYQSLIDIKKVYTSETFASKYKGVSLNRKTGKWISSITRNKHTYRLGQFDNEIDANIEFNKAVDAIENNTFDTYYNNRKRAYNKTSKYKGIYLDRITNKWVVSITYNKKSIYLGSFITEYEALNEYNKILKMIDENNFDDYLLNFKNRFLIPCEVERVYFNTKKNNWVTIMKLSNGNKITRYYKTKERAIKSLNNKKN